jgi:hypothetical protein
MRRAVVAIKILLLLSAFIGTGNSYAICKENKHLFGADGFDIVANTGQQYCSDGDKAAPAEFLHPCVISSSPPDFYQDLFIRVTGIADKPLARAPPVNFLA